MQSFEEYLTRWRTAGLIDEPTAAAIRNFESAEAKPSGQRWQVIVALVLGGILLGAGVLLFVAAHWDDVSPLDRLALVMAMLALFHGAGIASSERFGGFATTMHALGTVASGAAIALVGQIFNMQEHWPAAVMLWAFCAIAGWALLGDEFQQTLALLLAPAWLLSEWSYRADVYSGSDVYLYRMIAVIAAVPYGLPAFAEAGCRVDPFHGCRRRAGDSDRCARRGRLAMELLWLGPRLGLRAALVPAMGVWNSTAGDHGCLAGGEEECGAGRSGCGGGVCAAVATRDH
jgi:hypothetical protein